MSRVFPKDWLPVGVAALEPAANEAVRATGNALVIAGPGAGKTELLAQRACYLLQTGLCRCPSRILAISFKRDAARNLQERVLLRCGRELASRFDSMTFDAFAKGLLDRFRLALPAVWLPTRDYAIDPEINERNARRLLDAIPIDEGGLTQEELASLVAENVLRRDFLGHPLSAKPAEPTTLRAKAASALWQFLLHHESPSRINLQMVGRLAELLLRSNPRILRALRATYGFVFLDEFQDTTGIQYELTKTAFCGSSAVLSAVGDNKQRIMGWAGALDNVFGAFQADFAVPTPIRLVNNYRSAPELVRVLGFLTKAIDPDAATPVAIDDGQTGRGECRVLLFEDHKKEATWIAQAVEAWITADKLRPRDICILVRQRSDDYTETVRASLQDCGIEARIESDLQDVLSEPASTILIDTLKLAVRKQAPQSRAALLDLLTDLEGGEIEIVGLQVERKLNEFLKTLRSSIAESTKDEEGVRGLVDQILSFFGRATLGAVFPRYSQGDLLDKTVKGFVKGLTGYLLTLGWSEALDALEGIGSVPIMTMHKSKGLEYHSVVFVGLEDSALWGFARSEDEETRGFFVAFSRAKKRVLFTFSEARPRSVGRPAEGQSRRTIGKLYDLLKRAGVSTEKPA